MACFYFGIVPTIWPVFILELSRQYGLLLFWNYSDNMACFYFGIVPTIWPAFYFGIVPTIWPAFYFGIVPTIWPAFILELFRQYALLLFWNCSDNMACFYFGIVLTIWPVFILKLFRLFGLKQAILSEQFQNKNRPYCRNNSKIKAGHIVGTIPK
jgi:hypothetical protein